MGSRINWEYKTLTFEAAGFWSGGGKLDAQLLTGQPNELGSEGWELVSIFDTTKHEGQTRQVYAVLKRVI
jgi:hypothetical protein